MINVPEVVRMKIPFPDISSSLAAKPHMYVCMRAGSDKAFVKCQTLKPYHLQKHVPPFEYIEEQNDINRNPFQRTSIIDCDKKFLVNGLRFNRRLITTSRPDICQELYDNIQNKIDGNVNLKEEVLNTEDLKSINGYIN